VVKGIGAFLGLLILGCVVRYVLTHRRHHQEQASSLATGAWPDHHA